MSDYPIKWKQQLDIEYTIACPRYEKIFHRKNSSQSHGKAKPISMMEEITKGFFKEVKKKENNEGEPSVKVLNTKTLKRIHYLSEKQLNYYKSKKFHFDQFFSAVRNLITHGKFHSSAYLAKKKSEELLKQMPPKPEKTKHHRTKEKKAVRKHRLKKELKKDSTPIKKDHKKTLVTKTEAVASKEHVDKSLKETILSDVAKMGVNESESGRNILRLLEVLLKKAEPLPPWDPTVGSKSFCVYLAKPLQGKVRGITLNIRTPFIFKISQKNDQQVIKFENNCLGVKLLINLNLLEIKCDSENLTFVIKGMHDKTQPVKQALADLENIQWS